jgi:hypothetical protein
MQSQKRVKNRLVTPAKAGVQIFSVKGIKRPLDSGLQRNDAFGFFPGFFNSLPTGIL